MEGMSSPARLALLTRAFGEAGGVGSKVLIRRVWLGRLRAGLVEDQRAVYESYAAGASSFGEDQTIASDDPGEMVERLAAIVQEVGADALNLRVQLPGLSPEQVRDQIADRVHGHRRTEDGLAPAGPRSPAQRLADRCPAPPEVVAHVDVEGDPGDLPGLVG